MPRQPRAEAVQTERRRRRDDTVDRVHQRKLAIPAEFRDDKDHEYRWINDVNDRVHALTVEDDWDICRSSRAEGGADDRVRRTVGKDDGQPIHAYLVRKRKDWFEDDARKRAAAVSGSEQHLLTKPPTDDPSAQATMYVAEGSSIRRGAYAP